MMQSVHETPQDRYAADLQREGFREDPAQAMAVRHLQRLYEALNRQPSAGLLDRIRLFRKPLTPVRGLYLWGGTGRGKTWLVDTFYETLPFSEKRRVHFHRFMQDIHARLGTLPKTPNPLRIVARQLAADARVLCLDEFHVNDIADAMLLGGLLEALFEQGVTLVATSNLAVDELYLNGLQRDRFLFAIKLLKQYTESVHLSGDLDFRCALLDETGTYKIEQGQVAADWLAQHMKRLAPVVPEMPASISLGKRQIPAVALADDVVWFRFADLCDAPLWAADYLEIAQNFHTVLIADVPMMDEGRDDAARRFMHLIDALYDYRVKTVITAAAAPDELYQGRYLAFGFQRTASRLVEMGSHRYLGKPHRPAA